jgi:hypothetical protein
MGMCLTEDHLNILGVTFFQLLLQVTTPVLVLTVPVDITLQALKLNVGESIGWGITLAKSSSEIIIKP